jgi:hypothetical protein
MCEQIGSTNFEAGRVRQQLSQACHTNFAVRSSARRSLVKVVSYEAVLDDIRLREGVMRGRLEGEGDAPEAA